MSIKYKITLSILILVLLALLITIYFLSFKKYKPALQNEIKNRIMLQIQYISPQIDYTIAETIAEKNLQLFDLTCQELVLPMFKQNAELSSIFLNASVKDFKFKNGFLIYYLFIQNKDYKHFIKFFAPIEKDKFEIWQKNFLSDSGKWTIYYKPYYDIKKNLENDSLFLDRIIADIENNIDKPFNKSQFETQRDLYSKSKNFITDRVKFYNKLYEIFKENDLKNIKSDFEIITKSFKNIIDAFSEISSSEFKVTGSYNPKIYFKKYNNFLKEFNNKFKIIQNEIKEIKFYVKDFDEFKILIPTPIFEKNYYIKSELIKFKIPLIVAQKKVGFFDIGISEEELNKKINPIIKSGIFSSSFLIIFSLIFGIILSIYIVYPINKLSYEVDQITKDINYRIKTKRKDEFGKFSMTFNSLSEQIINELKKYEKLYKEATEDGLTKLIVRRYYLQFLSEELELAKKEGKPTSLLMTDIDHFKKFNDTYGHQAGDLVLAKVAEVILKNIRTNRIRNDIVGRYGGEEFSLLLPNTTKNEALNVAERLRKEVENTSIKLKESNAELKVTISIGVTTSENSNITVDEIIAKADKALYHSKETGRNKVSYYE